MSSCCARTGRATWRARALQRQPYSYYQLIGQGAVAEGASCRLEQPVSCVNECLFLPVSVARFHPSPPDPESRRAPGLARRRRSGRDGGTVGEAADDPAGERSARQSRREWRTWSGWMGWSMAGTAAFAPSHGEGRGGAQSRPSNGRVSLKAQVRHLSTNAAAVVFLPERMQARDPVWQSRCEVAQGIQECQAYAH